MSTPQEPREIDHQHLRDVCAQWDSQVAGRLLHRVLAGPGWVRLLLEGQDHLSLLLVAQARAQANILWPGKLPPSLRMALKPQRDHPLDKILKGYTLEFCRVLQEDRVVGIQLISPTGKPVVLWHQNFGTRGNLVLLDHKHCLLWAEYRPPHSLLTKFPRPGDWAQPDPCPPSGQTSPAAAEDLQHLAHKFATDLGQTLANHLRRKQKTSARLVANLDRDLAVADRGEEFRRKAEALAVHLHELQSGQSCLDVPDPRDGSPLNISLDPALSPAANLALWFKRAGKAAKGRQIIADRLLAAQTRLQRDIEALENLAQLQTGSGDDFTILADLQAWGQEQNLPPTKKDRGQRSPYSPEQPARPFRRYRVEDRWEIWVGRNNKENDLLTHRSSHLKDLWFHAQAVAGSHVILRTLGNPEQVPRRVIAKAAALAALNSKAKHANLVPVVYTERRYVRKPRKSAPGLAVCLREKTIMVTPGIGPDVQAF